MAKENVGDSELVTLSGTLETAGSWGGVCPAAEGVLASWRGSFWAAVQMLRAVRCWNFTSSLFSPPWWRN